MSRLKAKQIFLTGSFSGSFSGDGSAIKNVSASSADMSTDGVFLIKSGSSEIVEISGSSQFNINIDLFLVKNFETGEPLISISKNAIQFSTQSFQPTGSIKAGSIWFTSNSLYIALE